MPKVLITGIAGFMGSHVADKCLELGYKVHGIDDLSGGLLSNVPQEAKFHRFSILDVEAVAHLFERERFDYVFHLAAYAAEGLSHFIRRFNYSNNVIGSVNLINASIKTGVRRFIFTSSIAVYASGTVPMVEETTPAPEDPYGIGKYCVEMDLKAAGAVFRLDYVIFRPHNVYGERQNTADHFRNVIGIFMRQVYMNQPVTIFGDGLQTRAFTHIDDVSSIIAQSADHEGIARQTFNLGTDVPRTVLDVARITAKTLGRDLRIVHFPARHEVVHAWSSHAKLTKFFDVPAPVSLEEGISRMAEWFTRAPRNRPVKYRGIELRDGLPRAWEGVVE